MTIHENEGVMLLLGVGILFFVFNNYRHLIRFPYAKLLVTAFSILVAGWTLTIMEHFFWADICNVLEHVCYTVSGLLTAVWLRMAIYKKKGIG